ncbi:MAG: ATP-binding protein [Chitinophagaceae bacterium]|nr:ATP-binding protein [Panacibacter sp.]
MQKNTSAGTGLGLSLSYDIVKAHGGEIKVETNKNEGSSFIIKLYV